jgi:ABC-2 type transport system permease protein
VLLLGKSLAGVMIGVGQAMLVLAIAAPFVEFEWQYGILSGMLIALAAVVLLNLFLGGIALALASRVSTMQGFHLVMNLVLFPLLFFSGAFFPIHDLPLWLEVLSLVNPLTYAVDAVQLAAYAESGADFIGLGIDFAVLAVLAAGVQLLSLGRLPKLTWSGR